MSDILSRLAPPDGAKRKAKRIGRGIGSGNGTTAGRGEKGQKARSTGNIGKKHFQGGQTPIQRRLPKRGFRNIFGLDVAIVNVGDLDRFDAGAIVDEVSLRQARLVQGQGFIVKVLGDGELTKSLTVHAQKFSASAVEKIEKAGGKVVVLGQENETETENKG